MTMVVTPTASGTVTLKGEAFALQVNGNVLYNCQPATTGGGPAATLVVGTSSTSPTSTPTTTPTTTPTNTPTTNRPTRTSTVFETVTPTATVTGNRSRTPKAGADTGAGGETGPDGRMFIFAGTALIAVATAGGLVMRRRNAARS
ncbi:MAG TPA: hypothetical protein VFV66_05525 [Nonomuraea sp.]|nr:hypothetical protein [Nonomuraea sp.]